MSKLWRTWLFAVMVVAGTALGAEAQTFTALSVFTNGYDPQASLIQNVDGNYYGTTASGGNSGNCPLATCGTVFSITPSGRLTTLHDFENTDGEAPVAALVLGTDGQLYGTTELGGDMPCPSYPTCGTVFKVTTAGTLTSLHGFCAQTDCADGVLPLAPLVQGPDGSFYGTTEQGGGVACNPVPGCGTVFKITSGGKLTTLYRFCAQPGCLDGNQPAAGLVMGNDGNFYGTTYIGGPKNGGTLFKITPGGVLTTLYTFCSQPLCTDGDGPAAGLIQGTDGNLYGTASSDGLNFGGTVFKISTTGTYTTLYNFCSQPNCTDGGAPTGTLVQATDGNFYGTTPSGGANGRGTIFSITPNGVFTTLHTFCGALHCTDGSQPVAGLLQATNGNFYGTTSSGGKGNDGTVFRLNMGFGPFVAFVRGAAKPNQQFGILGQGFTGTTAVLLNGTAAAFTIVSHTFILATVPAGATTGYVTVTTPGGTLTSNKPFVVIP